MINKEEHGTEETFPKMANNNGVDHALPKKFITLVDLADFTDLNYGYKPVDI